MASTATAPVIHPQGRATIGRAIRSVIATFGVLAALAGVEHGIGEILQDAVPPPGVVFESWPDTPSFAVLNGEPAMTLVPNLLASGVLAIAVAVAVGAWSVGYVGRRHGGVVLVALSVLLLLVGGGFGPPLVGVILGIAAARRGSTARRLPRRARHTFGRLWPWFTAAGIAGSLGLMPGTVLLHELFTVDSEGLVYTFIALAFGGLILALSAARRHDRDAGHRA